MTQWHGRSLRKITGGRKRPHRKKRKFELGRPPAQTTIEKPRVKKIRTRGGNQKLRILSTDLVNVTNTKTGESKVVKLLKVLENPANPHFVTRNIVTKGAIVQTEIGKAKVTSRPGQHGVVNAILI
ncbi:MAG: 30S ribosomal protein S8e [Candidatus Hydrothermarchaeota archaeon]